MDVVSELTVKNLTPPGYFNLGPGAAASTVAYTTWWNNILQEIAANNVNLKTMILTPWIYEGYPSGDTIVSWLQYLLKMYGVGFFRGTNTQAAYIYQLISSGWSLSTILNITMVLQTFSMSPFSWFTQGSPAVTGGNLVSSLMDTGFLIYSTASSAPSTPSPTAYVARNWTVPTGWTNKASSATYYSRGYISGSNLVWCTPRPVSDFTKAAVFSAAVPVAIPSAGTIAIVNADGTGDIASIYYSDGTAWRKNSTPNADLGQIVINGARPIPEALTVWAPNPSTVTYAVDSQTPPPTSGATQGYGTFATWAEDQIYTNQIMIYVTQIAGGTMALTMLIELLRRVKPLNVIFNLFVTVSGVVSEYVINDVRQAI